MKFIPKTYLIALFSIFIISCSSDDDNGDNSLSEAEFKAKIIGVWQIFSVIEDGEELQNEGCVTDTTFEFTKNNEFLAEYSVNDDINLGECVENSVQESWTYLGNNRIESPAFKQVAEIQFEGNDRMLIPSSETEDEPFTQVLIRIE